jgi:Heliorhodopsin
MTAAPTTTDAAGALTATDARRLLRLNVAVGLTHLVQAALILLLAKPASLPVGVSYLTGPPGSGDYGGPASLFDVRIDLAVAAFLLLAAIDHLAVASL